ncbi:pyridoxal-phosphate-dependent aminotransferase family protein [Limisalsivibrio acetivorans]|uniref:pyridoxal-phosphate-dependent aminotransferase family protein n=1 Tax=Limisalsivibrio acetivorans TaxID=1304888 RepID=UPI001EE2889B|nr:alanine--glyoxylate aminotransferase family protein [Limisalsivibrio acetivorans]
MAVVFSNFDFHEVNENMLKKYLLAPGPTPVPESVLLEMAKPILHHRTDEFSSIFDSAAERLPKLFGTEGEVLMLAGSGTAAMEAAVVNTLSPGDHVLVVNAGKFGQRWRDICNVFGMTVSTIDLEWGESVKAEQIEEFIKENPDTKAVLLQGSETSTTACHPVKEIASVTSATDDTLLIVDGITSVGVYDTRMDEWGIDVLVTGSQKAFMLPPGLAFIALSDRAWARAENASIPRYYFDLRKERKTQQKSTTAYTPALTLIIGLNKVLDMLFEEGLENVYRRHQVNGDATRAAVKALGFEMLAKDNPSNAATGFYLPSELDGGAFVKFMREKVGVTYAGGQDHLKGRILRISTLGYHDVFDTITAVSALEMGLVRFGADIELGKGVSAAQNILKDYIG